MSIKWLSRALQSGWQLTDLVTIPTAAGTQCASSRGDPHPLPGNRVLQPRGLCRTQSPRAAAEWLLPGNATPLDPHAGPEGGDLPSGRRTENAEQPLNTHPFTVALEFCMMVRTMIFFPNVLVRVSVLFFFFLRLLFFPFIYSFVWLCPGFL